ncbi:MAG: acyltransferase [Planctomycetota bacterium]
MSERRHADYRATRVFGSLDGLRALAVIAVVWHHSPAGRGFGDWPATWRGYLGVDLFFVISGFLITTLLLREGERNGRIAVGAFFARRALRIFPLYFAVLGGLALALGVVWPNAAMAAPFFADLPWYASYTSNWMHAGTFLVITWSLAAEEQFYLAWAPLMQTLGERARFVAWAALAASVAATAGLFDGPLAWALGPRFRELDMVQATFAPLALGCLAAFSLHRAATFARAARVLGSRAAAPVAALVTIAVASAPEVEPLRYARGAVQLTLTALVVACVLREDHGLARALRLRPLARLGVVSYGVYLLHMLTLQGTRPLCASLQVTDAVRPWLLFALNGAAAWAAAEVSYRALERPCLRLKARFTPRGAAHV